MAKKEQDAPFGIKWSSLMQYAWNNKNFNQRYGAQINLQPRNTARTETMGVGDVWDAATSWMNGDK
jgi:hypothetical protein